MILFKSEFSAGLLLDVDFAFIFLLHSNILHRACLYGLVAY